MGPLDAECVNVAISASASINRYSSVPDRPRAAVARAVLFSSDPVERELLERYITRHGRDVHAFGVLGAALSDTAPTDILVLRLTKTTGAAPVEIARERLPDGSILALAEDPQTAIAAYRSGADIVAQLPIDLDLLCSTIDALVYRGMRAMPLREF